MFFSFLHELRRRKVPVGMHEAVALAGALKAGLHESSLDGFYYVARALLVHSERHLDAFDQAFAAHFRGAADDALELTRELLDWLKDAQRRELSPEERELLQQFSLDELQRMFEERLREQKERHDLGNRWIGTGGTSPFGHGGAPRAGFRVGGPGGNRSAVKIAEARAYQGYRDDLVLDVRQLQVALRKLRAFAREGVADELDVDSTVKETARNLGDLEIVTRPPRRSNTRVILLMDVGGSMDPWALLVSRLFTAASKASHFKEFRSYYFHNCIYGQLYETRRMERAVSVDQLIRETNKQYKLILVGDAMMAPYELYERGGSLGWNDPDGREGIAWLMHLADHYPRSVWLNPEPMRVWMHPTVRAIRGVFPMYPLTLEGLSEATQQLLRNA